MKILYVHFRPAKTETQVKAVADKVKLLKEVLTGLQLQGIPEVYTRDRITISDHLFELESSANSKHNEKRFDLIDIVVVEGDPNVLPWGRKNHQIKRLFEMCKATNKTLFACGLGMQLLVHFCAIGEQTIRVINGGEKGGLLQTISKFKSPEVLNSLTPQSVFLDHATGDFYSFDKYSCEWRPKGNVGMHYSKALEVVGGNPRDSKGGRELVSKTQVYRAQAVTASSNLFLQKATDVKCYVDKHHHGHYLFRDIEPQFVVDVSNLWDPHPVLTTSINIVKTKFHTMAESNRGPVIAMH